MADEEQWKIPPIVQELAAAGVQEPPSRYVVGEQARPAVAAAAMPEPIPIVDLRRLSANDGAAAADEAAKLKSALQNWGLFLAVGHGMDPGFLAEMMGLTRAFFNLPLDEKQKYSNLANGGNEFSFEGYGNDKVLSEDQVLDWNDRLYLTVAPESRVVRRVWPAQPPAFAGALREYTAGCRDVAGAVLAGFARVLGLRDERRFAGMLDDGVAMTHARFNCYPRCPAPDRVFGLKPHSDASVITVVLVDDAVSGLQVQKPGGGGGVWYDVPIVPNALLVNVGDFTEIMSNGLLRSPVHRVVPNAESNRVSLVMFYSLDLEKEIEPLPELVDDKRPRRYKKMTTKDYLAVFSERFFRGERALDTVKIDPNDDD